MGLSSSQARLLSLTSRMHDIEYKAQNLEAQKLQMANESAHVYKEYENALNATTIQLKQIGSDGSANFVDATYNKLLAAGYRLSSSGAIVISKSDLDYFNNTADKNAIEFACLKSGFCQKTGSTITLTSDPTVSCIFTEAQLKAQANSNTTKMLMDDINISSSISTLRGTLDGNGHTIYATTNVFTTMSNATVKNLNLDLNVSNTTSSSFGGLANTTNGTCNISDINLTGNITSNNTSTIQLGGLIGNTRGTAANISNITSNVDINYTGNNSNSINIGGLIGESGYNGTTITTVSNSTYNGNIDVKNTGSTVVGGISGLNWAKLIIDSCKSNSNITVENKANAGGLAGRVGGAGSTITNSSSAGTITVGSTTKPAESASAGGCIGSLENYQNPLTDVNIVDNLYSTVNVLTNVTGHQYNGDVIGSINYGSTEYSTQISNIASNNGTELDTVLGVGLTGGSKTVATFTEAASTDSVKNSVAASTNNTGASTKVNQQPSGATYDNFLLIGNAIASGNYILIEGHEDDPAWLAECLKDGFIILSKMDATTGKYYDINVATDTNLQEVSNKTALKKAEAKYEADMRKIDAKDKKFDTDLAALETERNAIKTEVDTLKTVAKDNVDRTFKLFS